MKGLNIKKWLDFPVDNSYRYEIEKNMLKDYYRVELLAGTVTLLFQVFMIILTFPRDFHRYLPRRYTYFTLYLCLFFITGSFLIMAIYLHHKKPLQVKCHIWLIGSYGCVLCIYSCIISLMDQHGGSDLSVFCYVVMAVAAFNILTPWQSLLLFSSSFALMNGLVYWNRNNTFFFTEAPNLFSLFINSLFMVLLSIVISITLYRYRVLYHYNQMLIQTQYEELHRANKELNYLALTDQLTKLGNRRFLETQLNHWYQESNQNHIPITGMLLDIDYFKQYNDHYGHQAGDVCLQEISSIIIKFMTDQRAFAARYGGEEFFICILDCPDPYQNAEELRTRIQQHQLTHCSQSSPCVTVSIGVDVELCTPNLTKEEFLHRCDTALYHAKNNGRNCTINYQTLPHL